MKQHQQVEGLVIRRANVGETDRIVTLLTESGKISAVAKAVRKILSKKAAALDLFNQVKLSLHETRGLPIIEEVQLVKVFGRLRTDFKAASLAYWAAELIDHLVLEDSSETLYLQTLDYLCRIEAGPTELDPRVFELSVLKNLGWQPELIVCVQCRAPLTDNGLNWSHELGGVVDAGCGRNLAAVIPLKTDTVKTMRLLSNQGFDVSRRLRVSGAIERELQEILHHFLEYVSERQFRSLELMKIADLMNPASEP